MSEQLAQTSPETAASSAGPRWSTAIAQTSPESVRIRGYDISDLAEAYDFGAVFYLIACGELPTEPQARVFNAMMIEACERGITPSSSITRTVASCGVPLQAAVAAGILSFGDKHGGVGIEMAAALELAIADHAPGAEPSERAIRDAAAAFVAAFTENGARVPGYGQPLHPAGDPRARRLMQFAESLGVASTACGVAVAAEDELARQSGRRIHLNVDGAIACIAVDIGFPGELIRGVNFVARAAGLCAHALEEARTSTRFRVLATDSEIGYTGTSPRKLPTAMKDDCAQIAADKRRQSVSRGEL